MNDVYQLRPVDGRGGLVRVATLVRGLRARTPQTLFVLAGDTLAPSVLSTLFQGRQMVEVWNAQLLEVDGAALRAILEHSVEALPRPNGRFLQTVGLDYTMDASRPAGSRILWASVGGRALEPARRYRVAVPDFLARGGDGYVLLAQSRSLVSSEDGLGLIEIVAEALERGASP